MSRAEDRAAGAPALPGPTAAVPSRFPRRTPSLLRRLAAEDGYALAVAAISRVVVYLLVAMVGWTTRVPVGTGFGYRAFLAPLSFWDARWYHWIALYGYDPLLAHGNTVAFFPLFPAIWRGLMHLPLPDTLSASLFNSCCFICAAAVIHRITRRRYPERIANVTVLLISFFPTSFVYSLAYSESVFLLAAALSFDALDRRSVRRAVLFAAVAIAARPVGVFLIPAIVIAGFRLAQPRWRTVVVPAATLAAVYVSVLAYLAWTTGNPLANMDAEARGWNRHLTFPVTFMWHSVTVDAVSGHHLHVLLDVGFVALWLGLLVGLWRMHAPPEYVTYSGLSVVAPICDGSMLSMGRLGMVAFPLFWALAAFTRGSERRMLAVSMASTLLLCVTIYLALGSRTYVP